MSILEKVKRLKELSAKATKGQWKAMGNPEKGISFLMSMEGGILDQHNSFDQQNRNNELIAESRNAIDKLCLCVEEMVGALQTIDKELFAAQVARTTRQAGKVSFDLPENAASKVLEKWGIK